MSLSDWVVSSGINDDRRQLKHLVELLILYTTQHDSNLASLAPTSIRLRHSVLLKLLLNQDGRAGNFVLSLQFLLQG